MKFLTTSQYYIPKNKESSMSSITESAPNICFTIRHSETFGSFKKGVLLTTLALAIITTVGAVLGVLALQGFNLGGINALTNLIGYKGVYLALLTGCSALLIDSVLIASLLRSGSTKQLSQREVDALELGDWLARDRIEEILEPGQYWNFPDVYRSPVNPTEEHPGEEAVFGIVVKNWDGSIGTYAYRSAEDCLAKKVELKGIGFKNGEIEAYPIEDVDTRQLQFPTLAVGQCATAELAHPSGFTVFAIKRKLEDQQETEQLVLCKSERVRADMAKGLFYKDEHIDALIRATLPDYASNVPADRLWQLPALDYQGRMCYPFCYKEAGTLKFAYCSSLEGDSGLLSDGTPIYHLDVDDGSHVDCLHFQSEEARDEFSETWRSTPSDAFSLEYVAGQIPDDLVEYPLEDSQFIAYEFALRNGTEIFYLKGKYRNQEAQVFFKSEEDRLKFINDNLNGFINIGLVNDAIHAIAKSENLKAKLTDDHVFWRGQITDRGQTFYILIFKKSFQFFKSVLEGQEWLQKHPQYRSLNG